jgi:hypothetical protein
MDAASAALNAALSELLSLVQRAPAVALAAGLGTHLFLLVLLVVLLARQGQMAKVQRRLLQGADGANLESLLLSHADEMHALRAQVEGARTSGQSAADNLRQCVQRVGVVRYDAYGDVGGRQSFSVALLDGGGNGLVLSGLYSRHDMRVYAKPVTNGDSPLQLTNEERRRSPTRRSPAPP